MTILRLAALSCAVGFSAAPAFSEEVARWVDSDAVTHFGNPQFAGVDAETVEIGPTNGMEAPSPVPRIDFGRTRFYKIEMARKSDKRGWNGYSTPNPFRRR